MDTGVGIWTKYDPSFASIFRSDGLEYMNIFTQFNADRSSYYLQYFIIFDASTQTLYHTIQFSLNTQEQHQFPIDATQSVNKWVYLYLGFQKSTDKYTIFLYEINNKLEIQMETGEGMYATVQVLEYFVLGSQLNIQNVFDPSIEYQYTTFRGQISDFYFLNGDGAFYPDIPTFVTSLENALFPMPDQCSTGIKIVPLLQQLTTFSQSQFATISTQYLNSRYTISGWARVDPLLTGEPLDTVLVRATLNQNNFDNSIIGDRMFLWKYKQSNQPELNGFYISTYGYLDPLQTAYQSKPDDEWLQLDSYYEIAITKWHYFVFEHGLTDLVQHTKLYIFFSYQNVEKTKYFLNRQQFDSRPVYVSIGGDKFDQNELLSGQISDFAFSYCFKDDQIYKIPCHYTCYQCQGPTANDCLSCVDPEISNRQLLLQTNECACKENFIEIDQSGSCIDPNLLFDNVLIEEFEETLICQYGEFLVQNQLCLKCPSRLQDQGFYCADCWDNPRTWYMNPQCTYDMLIYDITTPTNFIRKTRAPMEMEFYLIDIIHQQLNICSGCLGYQTTQEQVAFQTQSLGQPISVVCKSCFQYKDGQCTLLQDNCNTCQLINNAITCLNCMSGYVLTKNGCVQCPSNCLNCSSSNDQITCNQCKYGYGVFAGQCQQCGQFCGICGLYYNSMIDVTILKCFKCIDPYKYFQSFDGINCIKNSIPNCKIAHQMRVGLLPYYESSIDLFIPPYIIYESTLLLCMLCEPGYTNTSYQPLCSYFGVPAIESMNYYGTLQILLADTPDSLTPMNSRCNINQCIVCHPHYFAAIDFCVSCIIGYYPDVSGQCMVCPKELNCLTCSKQNKYFQDSWKWEIRNYYRVYVDVYNAHSYTQGSQTYQLLDYEVICLSCKLGTCIKDCEKGCQNCQIISGKSECVKCANTVQGQILSYENNNCMTCPYNCVYCRLSSKQEIESVNSEFNPDNSNLIPYSYQCLKGFSNPDLYFDWNINLFVQCTMNKVCYKKASFPLKVYCSDKTYEADLKASSNQEEFKKYNSAISEIFSNSQTLHFPQIENYNFYEQMNKKQIKQFTFQLFFEYNAGDDCIIPYSTFLNSTLRKNIFSLTNLELELNGDITKNLVINELVEINGFQKITFKNIKFSNKLDYIVKIKHQKSVEVIFNNILLENQIITQSKLAQFIIYNPKSITLNSFELSNCNIQNTFGLITYDFDYLQENQLTFNIQDFKIINSKFNNTRIFNFNIFQLSQNQHFEFNQITVQNSYFENTNLISNSLIHDVQISIQSTILIQELNMENINCVNSQFIILYDIKQLDFNNINIVGSQFQNSFYVQSNAFKITNFILSGSVLANSRMIINQKSSNQFYSEQINYELKNLEFINNKYDQNSQQTFLFIQKKSNQLTQVTVTNLKLSLNQLLYDNSIKDQQILSETANFYIQADNIILTQVSIIRAMGYPEFSLLDSNSLSISDLTSSLDSKYHIQTIHSSLQCVQQYLIEQSVTTMIYFLNNKKVLLENIQIDNLIVANLPLFLFKSLDRLTQQNIETIQIKNSQFNRITLIITKVSQQQSIIYIESEQEQIISIVNSKFTNNHQHSYISDETYKSSSTIQILSTLSSVNLNKLIFQSNIVTNSHSSNLFIIAKTVQITESNFTNINIINYENLKNNIVWSSDLSQQVYIENLEKILPIYSYGGCGNLNVGQLEISDIQVINSTSQLGGAFYIETQSNGILAIFNNQFQNTRSSMDYGIISMGGALMIDGSESYLQLNIQNCSFSQSYSRGSGGSIYVIPSKIDSNIFIDSVEVQDSFSFDSGVLQILKSTSATATLQVYLTNISINNTLNGIKEYLGEIVGMTQIELTQQSQNYLFFIQTGQIHINQLYIVSSILSGLLNLEDQSLIQINNFFVSKVQLGGQSLWKIKLQKCNQNIYFLATESSVVLSNIKFSNITQFEVSAENSIKNCALTNIQGDSFACLLNIIPPTTLNYYYQNYMKLQLALCHLKTLFTIQLQKESILQIISIKTIHKVQIQNTEFSGISCENCTSGLVNFTGIESKNNVNLISITNLRLDDNICGQTGCLVLEGIENQNYQLPIYSEIASKNTRILALQSEEKYGLKYSIQIIQSNFIRNSAAYGAGMFIIQITVLIDDCKFNLNEASQAGGAIFYVGRDKTNFNIYTSQLSNNKAKIGGAIYIMDSFFNTPSSLDILLMGNEAASFGTNLVVNPSRLGISLNKGQDILKITRALQKRYEIIDYVDITPYLQNGEINQFVTLPSGQSISSYSFYSEALKEHVSANLTFRIIPLNEQNKQMKFLSNTKCLISSRIISINDKNSTSGVFDNQNLNLKEVYFNETSQDYNLDSLIIKFDPNSKHSEVLQLKFTCNSIKIPVFSIEPPYLFESYSENYTLLMNLQTYSCQRGEFKNIEDGTCLVCDSSQDQFSVIAGSKCSIKDSVTTEEVTSVRLKLRSTYWRPWETSTKIEYCKNMPSNCEGGWDPGNPSCYEGHIGALCEQCDIYNIQGQGAYSISTTYTCGACSGVGDNLSKVILISLWTLFSITLSVNGTLDSIDQALLAKKMKKIGVSVNVRSGFGGILIKVLTNYFQILGTIATFQMQLPTALSSTFSSVSSPLEAMSYSLDCFLITLAQQSDIEMIYFRIIWGLLMPIFYITAFLGLYGIAALAKYVRKSMSVITTTFIYMYIFLQPTLISGFMALLSFRVISDVTWIQGNVAYQYNTPRHINWIFGFIFPVLGTVVVLIPLFMFWSLYSIRNTLDETRNRRNWGYLYNEYRQKSYFWELVKIQQKSLIIIFLIFYEDLIVIKAAMIFIIVFLYKMLSKQYQPYEMHLLNEYDDESSLICSLSIVVGITIYSATITGNQEIVWPFYIILLVINGLFIFKLGIQIIFTQLENQQEKLDKLRDKVNEMFPKLQHFNPILRYLLTNRNEQSKRVKQRFKQVKEYLFKIAREIIKFKENHLINSVQMNQVSLEDVQDDRKVDEIEDSPQLNRQQSNKLIKFNDQQRYQFSDECSPSI